MWENWVVGWKGKIKRGEIDYRLEIICWHPFWIVNREHWKKIYAISERKKERNREREREMESRKEKILYWHISIDLFSLLSISCLCFCGRAGWKCIEGLFLFNAEYWRCYCVSLNTVDVSCDLLTDFCSEYLLLFRKFI
jgi:hypothetical protein